MFQRSLILAMSVALMASSADAQTKKLSIGNFPFWSVPKQEFANQFVPGLNAALLLTDEQITKLNEARRETIDNETVRPRKQKDANLSDAEQEARRKATQQALSDLRIKASNILTAEQRRLIDQVNSAWQEAATAANEEFGPQLIMAKGDEERQKTLQVQKRERQISTFKTKLDNLLSFEQRAAMEQAAAQEVADAAKPKQKQ